MPGYAGKQKQSPRTKSLLKQLESCLCDDEAALRRLKEQLRFASELTARKGNAEFESILTEVDQKLDTDVLVSDLLDDIETLLEPIGDEASTYTLHYIGHAHSDLNWLWDYPESVHTCYRTMKTMVELMEEHPEFRFTQSQAELYRMMHDHAPELFADIRDAVDRGQWEVLTATWVEGDKNMASGEAQFRQHLHGQRYASDVLDIDTSEIGTDVQPDTFGHPNTIPSILSEAGIDYYYAARTGSDLQPDYAHGLYQEFPSLFRWRGPDGSSVLTLNRPNLWFNGPVEPHQSIEALRFESETDLREFLVIYGVGDHGGGPTRTDIATIKEMQEWPVFPTVQFSTIQEFFETVDEESTNLPVVQEELNFTMRGCYSTQSLTKSYNKHLQDQLPSTEALALIAGTETEYTYPAEDLSEAWRTVLFNQFHDILPGAGVPETYDHALGSYQEAQALGDVARERALDALSHGLYHEDTDTSQYGDSVPVIVFNPTAKRRSEYVSLLLYDHPDWERDSLIAVDENGTEIPVQVTETTKKARDRIERGDYALNDLPVPSRLVHDVTFGPEFTRVTLRTTDVPAFGYKIVRITEGDSGQNGGITLTRHTAGVRVESNHYIAELDAGGGAIQRLYDKTTDSELVPEDQQFGVLSVQQENPVVDHSGLPFSDVDPDEPRVYPAWMRGQIMREESLLDGWRLSVERDGPVEATVRWEQSYNQSELAAELTIRNDSRRIEWTIETDWQERGTEDSSIPALRIRFPIRADDPTYRYEIPFGDTVRDADGTDVPALRWATVSDGDIGLSVSNDTTYAYSGANNELSLTLLRSSYSPDPHPEIGAREISLTLEPHGEDWTVANAARLGRETHKPLVCRQLRGTSEQIDLYNREYLALDSSGAEVTAFKQSYDGEDAVIRIREVLGDQREVTLSSGVPIDSASETDALEQPVDGDVTVTGSDELTTELSPYEIKTIRLDLSGSQRT